MHFYHLISHIIFNCAYLHLAKRFTLYETEKHFRVVKTYFSEIYETRHTHLSKESTVGIRIGVQDENY